jgi:riboflavin biosynthesis pyrimidine reductase
LYKEKGICSIMVEGGSQLLQQFLDADYVDAIWKFTGNIALQSGIHAPIHRQPFRLEKMVGKDRLSIF